jgi:hypothetical protein
MILALTQQGHWVQHRNLRHCNGSLPYVVSYEYIPFAKPNGESAGTYNDMVYQIFLGVGKNLHLTIFNN